MFRISRRGACRRRRLLSGRFLNRPLHFLQASTTNTLGLNISANEAYPRAAGFLETLPKNCSREDPATRNPSTAFPNSRSRTPLLSAKGIRVAAQPETLARGDELHEKSC